MIIVSRLQKIIKIFSGYYGIAIMAIVIMCYDNAIAIIVYDMIEVMQAIKKDISFHNILHDQKYNHDIVQYW